MFLRTDLAAGFGDTEAQNGLSGGSNVKLLEMDEWIPLGLHYYQDGMMDPGNH